MLVASVAACEAAADFDAIRTVPEEVQKAAFAECAQEKGSTHWLRLNKVKSRDGLLYIAGSDGSGYTVGEAHGMNLCAWAKSEQYAASN
ncbi:hypothetical protein ROA7450_02869 [Roseovarius albus]|uniref:Uncharacterized protein n=2 Tax=Roseovarius albus TaxID=1247867 RepID=A0A1X6ZMM6_9RHOB|nr:hypothetical protein ROA7450_02869 [Roseovarius albus]